MGQIARNIAYNSGTKVLSGEAMHGLTMELYLDDHVGDTLRQGKKPSSLVKTTTVTADKATGKWSYDTTPLALSVGLHSVCLKADSVSQHTFFTV